jgi:hypothetical protein
MEHKKRNSKLKAFLHKFVEWGKLIIDRIKSIGMWADVMDPASGFPVSSNITMMIIQVIIYIYKGL